MVGRWRKVVGRSHFFLGFSSSYSLPPLEPRRYLRPPSLSTKICSPVLISMRKRSSPDVLQAHRRQARLRMLDAAFNSAQLGTERGSGCCLLTALRLCRTCATVRQAAL